MTDEIDIAQFQERMVTENAIRQVRKNAEMQQGEPGDCEMCGEWSGRLVMGACARCRDKYHLP